MIPAKRNSESGAMLIFIVIFITVLVGCAALVVDLGRYETIIRKMQTATDAAALSGVTLLETPEELVDPTIPNVYNTQKEITDYANVKKAVLLTLSTSELAGIDSTARTALCADGGSCVPSFRFNESSANNTDRDCANYRKDQGVAGNLTVTVRRQIMCLWKPHWVNPATPPQRLYFDIENNPRFYCNANSVKVDLTIRNIAPTFGRLLGVNQMSDVNLSATSFMDEPLPIPPATALCDSVTCTAIGGIENLLREQPASEPLNNRYIPNPSPTPWPGNAVTVFDPTVCSVPSLAPQCS